jgi:hypothetical protein
VALLDPGAIGLGADRLQLDQTPVEQDRPVEQQSVLAVDPEGDLGITTRAVGDGDLANVDHITVHRRGRARRGAVQVDQASEWVTGSSPIHSRSVFFSLMPWMKMSCSGPTSGSVAWGDLK